MFEEKFIPFNPLSFFHVETSCSWIDSKKGQQTVDQKEYLLPSLAKVSQEKDFAALHMGWNKSGLYVFCDVESPFQDVFYPDFIRGDSLELFIDTRDVKTSGVNTKFCHHFFFLPQRLDEHQAGEVTRFRTEDAHDLCDPKELQIKSHIHEKGYSLNIMIPASCLHGYDPDQFHRLGFTYRVNRYGASPQHFSVLSSEFKIEQQPSLWSSLSLIK